jgi:hypothetical protein
LESVPRFTPPNYQDDSFKTGQKGFFDRPNCTEVKATTFHIDKTEGQPKYEALADAGYGRLQSGFAERGR